MSVWNEIRKKSLGSKKRLEEIAVLYPEDGQSREIEDGNFDGNKYSIHTTGEYPSVCIQLKNHMTPISVFSSYKEVTLNIDGEDYIINVNRVAEKGYFFVYFLNRPTDWTKNNHNGKVWCMDDIRELTEKIITRLLEEEDKLFTHNE